MEWYSILIVFVVIILTVVLGVLIACMVAGQRCTLSIQQRVPNHELTQIQQENEKKQRKKISSRMKRTFGLSPQSEQPLAPVENVKTIEMTFNFGADQKQPQPMEINSEQVVELLPKTRSTQEEREERERKREAIRKKYNI